MLQQFYLIPFLLLVIIILYFSFFLLPIKYLDKLLIFTLDNIRF
ncbi:hypothetical protein RintRC_2008 [Richelia intracellularis]|nr:hypothetical protein RintRC_2008 [Richelia intracellularis]